MTTLRRVLLVVCALALPAASAHAVVIGANECCSSPSSLCRDSVQSTGAACDAPNTIVTNARCSSYVNAGAACVAFTATPTAASTATLTPTPLNTPTITSTPTAASTATVTNTPAFTPLSVVPPQVQKPRSVQWVSTTAVGTLVDAIAGKQFCLVYVGFDVKAANHVTLSANSAVVTGSWNGDNSGNLSPIGPCFTGPLTVAQATGSDAFSVLLGYTLAP